ncbi:g-type lectin s-receptor-like serine/threonine-protein kinase [Fagus crenata]
MEQSISKKSWCRFALLLLVIVSLKAHLSTASDTIYPGKNYERRIPNSTIGVLLDNGNFILTSKFHNNIVLWQSSDYPTNTWLPGAKLVYDRLNYERTTTLRSWKNNENPENGRFSVELEIEENGTTHLVLYFWRYDFDRYQYRGKVRKN